MRAAGCASVHNYTIVLCRITHMCMCRMAVLDILSAAPLCEDIHILHCLTHMYLCQCVMLCLLSGQGGHAHNRGPQVIQIVHPVTNTVYVGLPCCLALQDKVGARTIEGRKLRRSVLKGSVIAFVTAGYSGKRFIFEKAAELGVSSSGNGSSRCRTQRRWQQWRRRQHLAVLAAAASCVCLVLACRLQHA